MERRTQAGALWTHVSNTSGEIIPGYAVMRVVSIGDSTTFPYANVSKPNSDGQANILLNGRFPIQIGGRGQGHTVSPATALFETSDGTPAAGETWGAGASSWKLRKNNAGALILSAGDASAGLVTIQHAFGKSDGSSTGSVSSDTGIPSQAYLCGSTTQDDVTSTTTIYLRALDGGRIGLKKVNDTSNAWSDWEFLNLTSTLSITVPSTANTGFDIFVYKSAGVIAAETVDWTSDTARATDIVELGGIWFKDGDYTKRYWGSCRTTGSSGHVADIPGVRFIDNEYGRRRRIIRLTLNDGSMHSYTTATWRPWNNDATTKIEFWSGRTSAERCESFWGSAVVGASNPSTCYVGIGLSHNSTTSPSSPGNGTGFGWGVIPGGIGSDALTVYHPIFGFVSAFRPSLGYNYLTLVEESQAIGTTSWSGYVAGAATSNSGLGANGGMLGEIVC